MMNTFLFPHTYRKWGFWILCPALIAYLGISTNLLPNEWQFETRIPFPVLAKQDLFGPISFWTWDSIDIIQALLLAAILGGSFLVAFTKEPIEDEYTHQLRLSALIWAVFMHYLIQVAQYLLFGGWIWVNFTFLTYFGILFLFIGRFYYLRKKIIGALSYEK
jgi:hypothetical protein